jgi:hypothetical protein
MTTITGGGTVVEIGLGLDLGPAKELGRAVARRRCRQRVEVCGARVGYVLDAVSPTHVLVRGARGAILAVVSLCDVNGGNVG